MLILIFVIFFVSLFLVSCCCFIPCSFLVLPLHVNGHVSRRSRRLRRENAASCIITQTKDSCLIVESCSSCLYNKAVREYPRSFLARSLHVNGRFSRRSRRLRRGNAASCIISQTKDSCLIVKTMLFMFMQQSCEETCSLIPCSFLALSLLFPYV